MICKNLKRLHLQIDMKDIEITSVHNPKVKQWSQLLLKKGRDQQNKFLIEGIHLVQEALQAGADLEAIVYDADKGIPKEIKAISGSVTYISAPPAVIAKLSETEHPQGIVAILHKPKMRYEPLMTKGSLWVALDGVQDPGNLGTIIRSADAVGASAVLLGKGTVDVYNPKVVRSTMGSLFHLPVVEVDLSEWLPKLKSLSVQVLGAGLGSNPSCYDMNLSGPLCWVMGNEARGLSPMVQSLLDQEVRIPMPGQAESLNVAMATTVLLFESMRQRLIK
jgi:TrmH family RNA methyltransferase